MSSARPRVSVEDRRRFLRATSLGFAAIALGCRGAPPNIEAPSGNDTATGAPKPTTGASTSAGDPPELVAGDATAECRDTDDNIEGPYFKPKSPLRADLVESGMKGVRLTLRGRVLGTGCGVVLAGAVVDFWQADAAGAYFDDKFRGHQIVQPDGTYELHTVIPGHYLNGEQYRPAHVHVKVKAPGHPLLTTQLYFDGDPYNSIDPFIKKSLIMPLASAADGAKKARFDFVLA